MNNKQKEILTIHRHFLIKNIIWTERLAGLLKSNGMLTDSMLADIEDCSNRDDKISRLLDVLPLRGVQTFEKFCDILQLSGHYFLSDFLREEEGNNEKSEVSEVFKKLPFLVKALKDNEKKQLEVYIAEKIQSEQTRLTWKKETKEKDRWLDLKQTQLDENYEFEEERKTKNEKLATLEQETRAAQLECVTLRAEVKALENTMTQMQQKHKEDLAVQMRYNVANDNTIHKSNEKVELMEKVLRTIHIKIGERVKPATRSKKKGGDVHLHGEFMFILDDFEVLLAELSRLLEVEKTHEKLVDDCNWILLHLGFKHDDPDTPSLLNAYKQFTTQNEENMQTLRLQVEKYSEMFELQKAKQQEVKEPEIERKPSGHDAEKDVKNKWATGTSVWQAAIMNVMRKQLQDIKLEVRKKDSRITFQEEDIKKLRSKIRQYEKRYAREKEREKEKMKEAEEEKDEYPKEILKTTERDTEKMSPDGHVSAAASNDGMDKKTKLPPLRFGYISKATVSPTPRPIPMRHLQASIPRNFGPLTFQSDAILPEGLTTSPVKFENRHKNNMADGVGGLKTIHKRHKSSNVILDRNQNKEGLASAIRRKDTKVV